jgi:hypothetical protein
MVKRSPRQAMMQTKTPPDDPHHQLLRLAPALSSETIQRLTSLYPHARSVLDSYFADGQSVGDAPGSIDFLTDASSPVLIHESPGGGGASKRFLHRIRIASELLPEIRSGLSSLPRKYVSVHIRHTDHQTDYESYLATIKEELVGKEVLVCSDNAEVITAARSVFVRSNILTVTELPSGDPRPLHLANRYANSDKMKAATTNALIDLFALGASQKIYSTNVLEGYPSGFTKLAIYLSENKYLLRTLLSGENAIDRIRSTLVPVQYQANDLLRVAKSALNLR